MVSLSNHITSRASWTKRLNTPLCTYVRMQHNFFESAEGAEWPNKWFHDQPPPRFGTGPGSNSRPLELQSAEKNDSVNMHKAAESYSVNAADILGWLHDILRFFHNCLKILFYFKMEKRSTFVYFLRLTMPDGTSHQLFCCRTVG